MTEKSKMEPIFVCSGTYASRRIGGKKKKKIYVLVPAVTLSCVFRYSTL